MARREPWLAALLGLVLPGVGHIYAGKVLVGVFILVLYGFSWVLTLSLIGSIIGIPLLVVVAVWGIFGGYTAARAANRR